MSDPQRPTPIPFRPAENADRLDSWKEIASYLGREVRTVQGWEKNEGLPVHRHQHSRQGSVFAFKSELDAWRKSRASIAALPDPPVSPEAPPDSPAPADEPARNTGRRQMILAIIICAVVLDGIAVTVGLTGWFSHPTPAPLHGTPVTSALGQELDPSLSPEGTRVAYAWNGPQQDNFDIYVKLIGPGPPLRLTTDAASDTSPAWSRDGRSIAFLRELPAGRTQVIVIPSLGGPERVLATMPAWPTPWRFYPGPHLTWAPDGRGLIVSRRETDSQPFSLQYLALDSTQFRPLTHPPALNTGDTAPNFSPDGHSLVFRRALGFAVGQLYLLRLDDALQPRGEPELLTPQPGYAASPAFTSDGRAIVFAEGSYYEPSLWRLDLSRLGGAAGAPQALGLAGMFPSTGAQTQRLVYAASRIDSNLWEIERTPAGPVRRPMGQLSSTRVDSGAQYSPDGKRVVLHSTRSGTPEIWVIGRDGSNAVQLTGMGDAAAPRWSPDGSQIVFLARYKGTEKIYVIPAAGGSPRQVTTGPSRDHIPSWSRDGRFIYYRSTQSGSYEIWKVPAAGGQAVQVTHNGGDLGIEGPGGIVYYTRQEGDDVGVWKLPPGGPAIQVAPSSYPMTNLYVTDKGIYFTPRPRADGGTTVQLLRFSDGKVETIADLPSPVWFGLSVTPDDRFILYSQIDREESNTMMVDLSR